MTVDTINSVFFCLIALQPMNRDGRILAIFPLSNNNLLFQHTRLRRWFHSIERNIITMVSKGVASSAPKVTPPKPTKNSRMATSVTRKAPDRFKVRRLRHCVANARTPPSPRPFDPPTSSAVRPSSAVKCSYDPPKREVVCQVVLEYNSSGEAYASTTAVGLRGGTPYLSYTRSVSCGVTLVRGMCRQGAASCGFYELFIVSVCGKKNDHIHYWKDQQSCVTSRKEINNVVSCTNAYGTVSIHSITPRIKKHI